MNIKTGKPRYVFLIKRNGKPYRYMARITVKFAKHYLGCFKTEEEAIKAVKMYFKNPKKYERKYT
jgi:hypothetical protein